MVSVSGQELETALRAGSSPCPVKPRLSTIGVLRQAQDERQVVRVFRASRGALAAITISSLTRRAPRRARSTGRGFCVAPVSAAIDANGMSLRAQRGNPARQAMRMAARRPGLVDLRSPSARCARNDGSWCGCSAPDAELWPRSDRTVLGPGLRRGTGPNGEPIKPPGPDSGRYR
jgi:hypothetical protein